MAQINANQTDCHVGQNVTGQHVTINNARVPLPCELVSLDKIMESLKEQTKAVGHSFERVKLPFYDRECRMDDLYININCKKTEKDRHGQRTVVQESQESGRKYWVACTAHSCICFALLARSDALRCGPLRSFVCSLARSLAPS